MRIARVWLEDQARFGIVDGPELKLLEGHPLVLGYQETGQRVALKDVKLLAPTIPSKVVCVGQNYAAHAAEMGSEVADEPVLFLKPSSSVIGPGDSIVLPWQSDRVDLEAELAIVIGQLAKNVDEDEALDYVWGYTVANDVTARDLQASDSQWARAKGFDTFCPLGPWIETDFSPDDQAIESRVDGQTRQSSNISDMIFNIREIISYVSKNMTLLPGDVILTGTPSGISPIRNGEVVECEVEGIGTLINPVL